jgi:hypothetical protein
MCSPARLKTIVRAKRRQARRPSRQPADRVSVGAGLRSDQCGYSGKFGVGALSMARRTTAGGTQPANS